MQVFVSYRRDDTGGRAGRLGDALAARYGARNVYIDVASAEPGRDFVDGLDGALGRSDAMLVVIGRNWMGPTADGTRRIDRTDDFVRVEVGVGLQSEIPVVPVLVDGAGLPTAEDLPDELAGLSRRQAVRIHDESWHQDVDALVRRLDGELLAGEERRRRWPLLVVAVAAVAAAVAAVVLLRDDDSPESADPGETPPCPATDGSWTELDVSASDPTSHDYTSEGYAIDVAVVGVRARAPDGDGTSVLVDVDVANATPSVPGTEDEMYVGIGDFDGITIDGVQQGQPTCVSYNSPNPQIEPGERIVATVGFDAAADARSAGSVLLEGFDDVDLVVTSA